MIKLSEHFNILSSKLTKINVPHHKRTLHKETIRMPVPERVKISMVQHIGSPCVPIVKEGDTVRVGQVIAKSQAMVSAPIHASVSGTIEKIEAFTLDNGQSVQEMIIKSDGHQTLDATLKPPVISSEADFIQAVKDSGLVGLGGAGFPTHVKLNVSPDTRAKIDVLLINAAECEPYITSDARGILENAYDVLDGVKAVSTHLKVDNVIIGIEDQNQEVIDFLSNILMQKREIYPNISVKLLPSTYPQGAEKVLVQSCTHRVIPLGKLPSDVGVMVMNASSVGFLGRYLKTGIPLTLRRVTVDGSAIREPGNVWAPIGTQIKDLIAACGGYAEEAKMLLQGGPMTGTLQKNDEQPITKRTNAILAFGASQTSEYEEINCIRCARCIDVCPVNLMPVSIDQNVRLNNIAELQILEINACIDCGLCSFICPSNRTLVQNIRVGKTMLRESAEA